VPSSSADAVEFGQLWRLSPHLCCGLSADSPAPAVGADWARYINWTHLCCHFRRRFFVSLAFSKNIFCSSLYQGHFLRHSSLIVLQSTQIQIAHKVYGLPFDFLPQFSHVYIVHTPYTDCPIDIENLHSISMVINTQFLDTYTAHAFAVHSLLLTRTRFSVHSLLRARVSPCTRLITFIRLNCKLFLKSRFFFEGPLKCQLPGCRQGSNKG
jgi:hypothetical protein